MCFRFPHDDGSCTSSLSAYTPPSSSRFDFHALPSTYLSVGTESGVVSLFEGQRTRSGLFDFSAHARAQLAKTATNSSSSGSAAAVAPRQLKTLMSLTTKISATAYHPSGQILAMASGEVRPSVCCVF